MFGVRTENINIQKLARCLVLNGAVNDWLKDEIDYWNNLGEDVWK